MPLQTTSSSAPRRDVATVRRILVGIFAVLLLAYGAAIVWLMTQETRLVFQAGQPLGPARPAFPYEQVNLPRDDGARQFAWVMKAADANAPWVLFLHGNDATIASRPNIAHYTRLHAVGTHVFAPEYRGFGGLDGIPTERGLIADARVAYDYLRTRLIVAPEQIVIYGWSLGSAVAVALAAEVPSAAVILEGAPASIVAIGQQRYPLFPIRMVIRNPFESIKRIDRVRAPILFLHSPEDVVVPIGEGRRLYEAAPAPKTFVEVRGGHVHASEVDANAFFAAVERFLMTHHILPSSAAAAGAR
jgi:dipeptidyl aminopeptidase/acylaminoacyl peptidase